MTHDEMNGLYEFYLIGALATDEAAEIRQHLADNCPQCLAGVRNAAVVAAALSGMAALEQPPAHLRRRVLDLVRPPKESRSWMYAALGLGAACAALSIFAVWTNVALQASKSQVAELADQRDQLRSVVEILSQNDTRAVRFGTADNQPHGRVFVNPQRGVVFVGSHLPELAADRTFEFWLIPASGAAPVPSGLFRANAAGNVVNIQTTPVNTAQIKAVAVSVEPQGGSPAPTTKPILIVPLA